MGTTAEVVVITQVQEEVRLLEVLVLEGLRARHPRTHIVES